MIGLFSVVLLAKLLHGRKQHAGPSSAVCAVANCVRQFVSLIVFPEL